WKIVGQLEDAGCRIVSLTEHFDTGTAQGRMMLSLIAGIGELEAENISARAKASSARRLRLGQLNGGPPAFGYDTDGKTPHPRHRLTVERIWREFAAGRSQCAIYKGLNQDGVDTKFGGKWQQ